MPLQDIIPPDNMNKISLIRLIVNFYNQELALFPE